VLSPQWARRASISRENVDQRPALRRARSARIQNDPHDERDGDGGDTESNGLSGTTDGTASAIDDRCECAQHSEADAQSAGFPPVRSLKDILSQGCRTSSWLRTSIPRAFYHDQPVNGPGW
jgi:hypothetical protein